MELTKQRAKDIIENYEYDSNGLKLISGFSVEVVNIKIREHYVYADVILHNDCEGKQQRFNSVSYPISMFNEKK